MTDGITDDLTAVIADILPPISSDKSQIRPSAIASFLRSDQCQRQLRFNLYSRDVMRDVAKAADVELEPLPPTMTRSGRRWESNVQEQLGNGHIQIAPNAALADNAWKRRIDELPPGGKLIALRAGLTGHLGEWPVIESEADLILFERDEAGLLHILIVDLKASYSVELEHRIQVAIYALLLAPLYPDASIAHAVLYRQPLEPEPTWTPETAADKSAASSMLGLDDDACLSITLTPSDYLGLAHQLVSDPDSLTSRTASTQFAGLPFHISAKCDTCRFNRVCLATARSSDDLSLIPHLTEQAKARLIQNDISSVHDLASIESKSEERIRHLTLVPGLGHQLRSLALRANQLEDYRADIKLQTWNRYSAPSSLPAIDAGHNPDLIQIVLDLQMDAGTGRIALASASMTTNIDGDSNRRTRRDWVHFPDRPVESADDEASLIQVLIRDLVIELGSAARHQTDRGGLPIHLYVWDATQVRLLTSLANRQGDAIFGLSAVMDLMKQSAGFDGTNLTVLADEVRNQRVLPVLCQSLQTVAPWFGVRWSPEIRRTFRFRLFDESIREDSPAEGPPQFVPARSRFMSSIPSEYMQRAWNQLQPDESDKSDGPTMQTWSLYGGPTADDIRSLQRERLRAIEAIRDGLNSNRAITKAAFDLRSVTQVAKSQSRPIDALHEFVIIERHFEVSEWQASRSASPESRYLHGDSIPVRFLESDQTPEVLAALQSARVKQQQFRDLGVATSDLDDETRKSLRWSLDDLHLKLRIAVDDLPIDLAAFRGLTTIGAGDRIVISPLWIDERASDPRLASATRLLHGTGAVVESIAADGRMIVSIRPRAFRLKPGFGFNAIPWIPESGETLVIDDHPDAEAGSRQLETIEAIQSGNHHAAYDWMAGTVSQSSADWNPTTAAGQQRFVDGLVAFGRRLPDAPKWEPAKQQYIGANGEAVMTVVQGPPGTGKSTTSGMAIWARIQGSMAAGIPMRVAIGCKTHAATEVLLRATDNARERLRNFRHHDSDLFARYFDDHIFDVPLYRFSPRGQSQFPIPPGSSAATRISAMADQPAVICAATTHGLGRLINRQWQDGTTIWDLVLLDEASQISVPEFLVATTGLHPDGRMIVVGDHRQMPPIVHSVDDGETSTTIDPFPVWRSIFDFVRNDPARRAVDIRFSESFRIHQDVAEFLRRAVYQADNIAFHSARTRVFTSPVGASDLSRAVLSSDSPLILVLHDEAASQQNNDLEAHIAIDLIEGLASLEEPPTVGVVVPHRAQRAEIDVLVRSDNSPAKPIQVDTVERFQGDERDVIIYSATESDPIYLRSTSDFLFDPRRLNVAISRAREKLIVIASRSIFEVVPSSDRLLADMQIWRQLRDDVCTQSIWTGSVDGHTIEVLASTITLPDLV